MFVAFM